MAVVNEVITKFSFEGGTKPLGDYNDALTDSITMLAGFVAGVVAVSGALSAFVTTQLASKDGMVQLSRETGVSIEKIQELGFAASQSGSDMQAVESTIDSLSEKIGEASLKGSEDFARIGVSVRDMNGNVKSADTVLMEVSNRFKQMGLSMQEQKSMTSVLGIDSSLLQMMNKSSEEIERLIIKSERFGKVTKANGKTITDYNDSFSELKRGLDTISTLIAVSMAPAMEDMFESFKMFMEEHKDDVIEFFKQLGIWTNNLISLFTNLAPVIALIAGAFLLAKIQALGFAGTMALIGAPIILIAGIVAIVAIAIEDLIVGLKGGKSVINDFLKAKFDFDLIKLIEDASVWLALLWEDIVKVGKVVDEFLSANIDFNLTKTLEDTSKWLARLWQQFTDVGKAIKEGFGGALSEIADFFGMGDTEVNHNIKGENSVPQAYVPKVPQPQSNNQSNTNSNIVEQNINIEIVSSDPQATGQAVSDALRKQLNDARMQSEKGGR